MVQFVDDIKLLNQLWGCFFRLPSQIRQGSWHQGQLFFKSDRLVLKKELGCYMERDLYLAFLGNLKSTVHMIEWIDLEYFSIYWVVSRVPLYQDGTKPRVESIALSSGYNGLWLNFICQICACWIHIYGSRHSWVKNPWIRQASIVTCGNQLCRYAVGRRQLKRIA